MSSEYAGQTSRSSSAARQASRFLVLARRGWISKIIEPMITYSAGQARWFRAEPRRTLSASMVERIVDRAFPGGRSLDLLPLSDGLRNANFRLRVTPKGELFVLRIYEHDPSLCQKELDLYLLLRKTVPVPEVIYAEANGTEDAPPFALLRYVEGATFREVHRSGDTGAIAQAATSVGEVLASIGHIRLAKAGWLGPGLNVCAAEQRVPEPIPRFVDACLTSERLGRRVPAGLRGAISNLMWSWAPRFEGLEDKTVLAHGDFGKRNLLMKETAGEWRVAAVLDWEFAVSGTPLMDIGHFLRYERWSRPRVEPHFSNGYLNAGGVLPEDWRRLARIVDAASLCESLTHEYLPEEVVPELVELVRATVEDRDPQL
jgi:aminoglycoside phosphotransferase (APT) family kinase protein